MGVVAKDQVLVKERSLFPPLDCVGDLWALFSVITRLVSLNDFLLAEPLRFVSQAESGVLARLAENAVLERLD